MVVAQDHFTIADEYNKKLSAIIKRESKKRNKSNYICQAIIEKFEREQQEKLDDFVVKEPETELDFAPRIHEPLTEEYLKTLSDQDVGRLWKMARWNKRILDGYIASLNKSWAKEQGYDRREI